MSGLFDMYLRENILNKCEAFFMQYLEQEDAVDERLDEEDMKLVKVQLDYVLNMIQSILQEKGETEDAYDEIVDKLVGLTIVSKMNEVRLCKILNKMQGTE